MWDLLQSRPAVAIPINSAAATKVLVGGPCILIGWSFRETAANVTTFDFKDGLDANGQDAGSNALAASGAQAQSVGVNGSLHKSGITIVIGGTGTLRGAVWVKF